MRIDEVMSHAAQISRDTKTLLHIDETCTVLSKFLDAITLGAIASDCYTNPQ